MVRLRVQVGGTAQTVKRIKGMADLRTFKRVRVMVSGVMQTVFQFLNAVLSTDSVFGNVSGGSGSSDVTTSVVSVTVTGGTAPFTYLWQETSNNSSYTWVIGSSATASTSFTAQSLAPLDTAAAGFTCTVTDADGNIVITGEVTASAANLNPS
jgi:hypothetical protein